MVKQEAIRDGVPKSGRIWKVKQTERASSMNRRGVLSHMAKSYEEKQIIRQKKEEMKALQREMIEEKKMKIRAEKERRAERAKQRAANEFKNSSYQMVSVALVFSGGFRSIIYLTVLLFALNVWTYS